MASIAMLVGGTMVNALAFSGSNYLFSMLRSSDLNEERKRHDKAIEQLQDAQAEWSRKRTERLHWISEDLRRQGHAVQTFRDVDDAIREYWWVTGKQLDPLGPEPKLSDFYAPSTNHSDREIAFVVFGMTVTGIIAYNSRSKEKKKKMYGVAMLADKLFNAMLDAGHTARRHKIPGQHCLSTPGNLFCM